MLNFQGSKPQGTAAHPGEGGFRDNTSVTTLGRVGRGKLDSSGHALCSRGGRSCGFLAPKPKVEPCTLKVSDPEAGGGRGGGRGREPMPF